MKWYNYLFAFSAGIFLANTVPHFIHGISGDAFPTPFANPPGKGLSPPLTNVIWALVNLVTGILLVYAGKVTRQNRLAVALLLVGVAVISSMLSIAFMSKLPS